MIVEHKFQIYKLLPTKLIVTKLSGYQIVGLPNFQVTKCLVTKLLVTENPPIIYLFRKIVNFQIIESIVG